VTPEVDICAVLGHGAVVVAFCLLLHVVWWRLAKPQAFRAWVPALAVIFLACGPAAAWWLAGERPLTHWVAVLVLHVPFSVVYIIGYTLLSAFSPSIEMMKLLERSPGLDRRNIQLPYLRSALGTDRVRNLLHEGMIREEAGSVVLGPRARLLTAVCLAYRHFVGLPDGAGG
jgi:hypothetical protein